MNCIVRRLRQAFLLWTAVLTIIVPSKAQDINVPAAIPPRPAITVLDSTKEQDGLVGSVRRVKTETARIELKDGRAIEGPTQLVELTTYGIKGNRIENTSYPIGGALVGKEEYKYDEHGNITEMTVRDNRGAILNREAYSYEFDKVGNWTKMVTSLVVFENGELKREPIEVTYRTLTYYFDDNIAKIVDEPRPPVEQRRIIKAPAVPEPGSFELRVQEAPLVVTNVAAGWGGSVEVAGEPPPLLKPLKPEGAESAFVARKKNESVESAAKSVGSVAKPNPAATDQKHAYDLYVAGRNQFDAGDAAGAIDSYLQSIKLEPKSAEVHLNLGHAYLRLKKDKEAVKAFKESTKLNPNVAEAQYGLGFVNFRLGRFRDAADAFKKATILEPRMAKAHYGLALAAQELEMTTVLLEEYRVLETLDKGLAKKLAQTFPQFNFSCRAIRGCP